MSELKCEFCGHDLEGNNHGPDQNDYDYDPNLDNFIHSGSCTYCKECNPQLKKAPK